MGGSVDLDAPLPVTAVRRWAGLAATVLVTAVLAGCGGSGDVAPPPAHDPPVGFAASTGRLPSGTNQFLGVRPAASGSAELPVALAGTSVWVTDSGRLERIDSVGAVTPVALPPGAVASGAPWADADGTRVLAATAVVIPGSGTTPPGLAVQLVVVDAASATVTATVPAALPWNDRPGSVRLRVAGAPGGLAVVSAGTDSQRTTVGVDVAGRRVLWTSDGVDAAAVLPGGPAGPVAVGASTPPGQSPTYSASSVLGLDLRTGTRRFALFEGAQAVRGAAVSVAGPDMVAVSGREARRGSLLGAPASLLFVGADGAVRRTEDLGNSLTAAPPHCWWDEASTTVCSDRARVFALDAATAFPLWALPNPAANRVAPTVTTAWHGAVYGSTVNGPVVLDARTGADRDAAPGAAPVLVNAYLGVAAESGVAGIGGGAGIHPAVR